MTITRIIRTAATLALLVPMGGLVAQSRWSLDERARLDVTTGTHAWTTVNALLVQSSGDLVVLDREQNRIDVFNASGRWKHRIGGTGSGPGEMRSIRSIGQAGDTLWVADDVLSRLTLFTLDGKTVGTETVSHDIGDGVFGRYGPAGRFKDGSVLTAPAQYTGALDKPANTEMPLWATTGHQARSHKAQIATVRLGKVVLDLGGGALLAFQPFRDGAFWNLDPNGEALTIVDRAAASQSPATFRLRRLRASGEVLMDKHVSYTPTPLAQRSVDSTIDHELAALAEDKRVRVPDRGRIVRGLYMPRFIPPVSDFVSTYDGMSLVQRQPLVGTQTRWEVFDSRGELRGEFLLPKTSRPLQLQGDDLWVAVPDELDVVTLVRYRVRRGRSGTR